MTKTPKHPRDPNQLAKLIVDVASGEIEILPATPKEARAEGRITPAMAAGVTDHLWEVADIADLVKAEEIKADHKRGPYKKRAA